MSTAPNNARHHAIALSDLLLNERLVTIGNHLAAQNRIEAHMEEHFFQPAGTGPTSISIGPGAMPANPAPPAEKPEIEVTSAVTGVSELMAEEIQNHLNNGWTLLSVSEATDGDGAYGYTAFFTRVKPA